MAPPRKHRDALLGSAVSLFRKQGYATTGLAEILEASGAPKGSLYHYFPGGKTEIGAEAVQLAGTKVAATLRALATESSGPADLLDRYLTLLAGWMRKSGYRDGCPITTTLLETVPEHAAIRAAGEEAFAAWSETIAESARQSGIPPKRAASLGRFAIAALEGALIQCRVTGDDTPLKEAAAELRVLFETAQPRRR